MYPWPEPLYNDPHLEIHNLLDPSLNGDDTLLPHPILSPWLSSPLGFEYGQCQTGDELFDQLTFGNDIASPDQVNETLICKRREVAPTYTPTSQSNLHAGGSLRRLKRIEGGYTCGAAGCSRSFSRNCDLTKHFQRAHLNEADRPLGCDLCNRRFSDRQGLNRHTTSHYKRDQRRLPPQQSQSTAEVPSHNDMESEPSSPVGTSRASPEARSSLMWKLARLHVIGLLSRVAQEVCHLAERNYIWFENTSSGLVPRLRMDINPFDVVLEREWRKCERSKPAASDSPAQPPLAVIFSLLDSDQNWQLGSILENNRLGYSKVTTSLTTRTRELSDDNVRVDSMRAFVSFLCWGLDVPEPEWNDRQVCCLKERLECSMDDWATNKIGSLLIVQDSLFHSQLDEVMPDLTDEIRTRVVEEAHNNTADCLWFLKRLSQLGLWGKMMLPEFDIWWGGPFQELRQRRPYQWIFFAYLLSGFTGS